jgi:hypothetical protein
MEEGNRWCGKGGRANVEEGGGWDCTGTNEIIDGACSGGTDKKSEAHMTLTDDTG